MAKLYYTSSLGSNWEKQIIFWDQSQVNWDQLDPSQDRTIPNPDHPPLWICLICWLFWTKKKSFGFTKYLILQTGLQIWNSIRMHEAFRKVKVKVSFFINCPVDNMKWNKQNLPIFIAVCPRPSLLSLLFAVEFFFQDLCMENILRNSFWTRILKCVS